MQSDMPCLVEIIVLGETTLDRNNLPLMIHSEREDFAKELPQ